MKSLRPLRRLSAALVAAFATVPLWADGSGPPLSADPWTITKDLFGATGAVDAASDDWSLVFAWGESMAGAVLRSAQNEWEIDSGYLGGGSTSGNFKLVSAKVGPTDLRQDGVQVGVPHDAIATLVF